MREMADALWEGQTLLKTGVHTDGHMDRHTHRHTNVKTVYPPVSLRSLGGLLKSCVIQYEQLNYNEPKIKQLISHILQ